MLSNAELDAMRVDIESLMPDTCIIKTLTQTPDGQGGFTDSWGPSGTVVCRLDSTGGQKNSVSDSVRSFSSFVLTVPHNADLSEANQVTHDGTDYNVIAVDYDKSWPVCLRAHLERT